MKLTKVVSLLVLALVIAVAASGCRKKPGYVTVIPGSKTGSPTDIGNSEPLDPNKNTDPNAVKGTEGDRPQGNPDDYKDWNKNSEIFKAYTVYFDFDSSVVKDGEKSKVAAVAEHLKSNAKTAVQVEGNCDQRGTEEYNRSLGERRALAVREELISLGVEPKRVVTVSYGEDKPAVQGENEAAYSKNRRDDFVLLTPP